jgi:flagellin-like protein
MGKGVSSLVSLIVLLLITIALVGSAFLFFSGTVGRRTSEAFSIHYTDNRDMLIIGNEGNDVIEYIKVSIDNKEVPVYLDGKVIYQEDFEDDLADGWVAESGIWSVESKSYKGDGTLNLGRSSVNTNSFQGAIMEYDIKFGTIMPTDIILLLDKSQSMENELADAKNAAKNFIDQINPSRDRAGIVSFSTDVVLDHSLSSDQDSIKSAIDSITIDLYTAIDVAIDTANNELINNGRSGTAWVEILLSDGDNNCGILPEPANCDDRLNTAIQNAIDNNIVIYTIGLGPDADESTLSNIASMTGGTYYFSPTATDLYSIYDEIAREVIPPGASSLILKNSRDEELIEVKFSIDPDTVEIIDPSSGTVHESQSI